jgi:CRP-like cAMP-binding protein
MGARTAMKKQGRMSTGFSQSVQLQLLRRVPEPLRTDITHGLRVIKAPRGRTLVEKGSRSTDVFVVLEGQAKVLLYSANGREVIVHDVGPGDLFGDIAVLDGEPRSASIVASSELRVAVMRSSDFMAALESSPGAGIWLARTLASSVRRLTRHVFELSALNVQTRIHCELLRLARRGQQHNGVVEVRPAPTHAELASRVGTHREAVTRELRLLSDRNVIRYGRRSLTIIDPARLEQVLDR